MPKFNADEKKSLFEPIEITLEGKKYEIKHLTADMIDRATKGDVNDIKTVALQTATLLGADYEEMLKVDLRKLGAVNKFILETFQEQLVDSKNEKEAGQ